MTVLVSMSSWLIRGTKRLSHKVSLVLLNHCIHDNDVELGRIGEHLGSGQFGWVEKGVRTVIIIASGIWSIVHRDLAARNMTKRLTCKVHS